MIKEPPNKESTETQQIGNMWVEFNLSHVIQQ